MERVYEARILELVVCQLFFCSFMHAQIVDSEYYFKRDTPTRGFSNGHPRLLC